MPVNFYNDKVLMKLATPSNGKPVGAIPFWILYLETLRQSSVIDYTLSITQPGDSSKPWLEPSTNTLSVWNGTAWVAASISTAFPNLSGSAFSYYEAISSETTSYAGYKYNLNSAVHSGLGFKTEMTVDGKIKINTAGKYEIDYTVNLGTGSWYWSRGLLLKNGNIVSYTSNQVASSFGMYVSFEGSTVVDLAANDLIHLYAEMTNGRYTDTVNNIAQVEGNLQPYSQTTIYPRKKAA